MRLLAIDTALDACSVTVFDTERDRPLSIESREKNLEQLFLDLTGRRLRE